MSLPDSRREREHRCRRMLPEEEEEKDPPEIDEVEED
jgi:hypothetical protein